MNQGWQVPGRGHEGEAVPRGDCRLVPHPGPPAAEPRWPFGSEGVWL